MWKRINRWANNNTLLGGILAGFVVWVMTSVTVEMGPRMSSWQYEIVWFLVAIGWIALSVTLAVFSRNMWEAIKKRQEDLRQVRENREKDLEKERENREEQHQLAVKIWQECKGDFKEIREAWFEEDEDLLETLITRLARKLRNLDPYLFSYGPYDLDSETVWLSKVSEIMKAMEPSADALDHIRTQAGFYMVPR